MKGDLVKLVPVGDEDFALLASWAASASSSYSSGAPQVLTVDDIKSVIRSPGMNYLMVRTLDGRTVGAVNWQPMTYPGSFTLGNVVGDSSLWGLGYGVESVSLLMEFLFHAHNAHRIHLLAGVYNKPMIQIFTQGVVRVEGVLRDYFFVDGEYHDAVVGSILRHEYYEMTREDGMAPRDVISEADKREARELLRKHLANNPIDGRWLTA